MDQKSVKKNYIFSVFHLLSLIVIHIAVIPYISRVLTPDGVGEYSFSNSLTTYFVVFAALAFTTYAQREIAKYRDNIHQQSVVFWEIFFCRLMMVVISFMTNLILIFCGVYGKYTVLMSVLSINIVAVAFDIAFFFYSHEEFGKVVSVNLIIKLIGTIGIFVFVKRQDDVWIYVLLNTLIAIISNLTMWCFIWKRLVKVKLSELKPMKHFKGSFVLSLPAFAGVMYTVLDKSLIGLIAHSDAENGYYEQAEKIIKKAMMLVTCLGSIMLSRNTYEIKRGNANQVKENNYNSIHFLWLVGIPLTCGMIFTASNLVPWFLGTDFNESILLIQVLSSLILLMGMSSLLTGQYLLPYKKDKQYTLAVMFGAMLNLIMNIPLIYFFGPLGAAFATIIAELSVTAFMLCLAAKDLAMGRIFKTMVKPLLASLIMSAVICPLSLYLTPSIWHTFIIIGCGAVAYTIAILILRDQLVMTFLHGIKLKFCAKSQSDGAAENLPIEADSVKSDSQDLSDNTIQNE